MITKLPKYTIQVFHPAWYKPWGDRQVALAKWDGRSRKYKPVNAGDVRVVDIDGLHGTS